MSDSTRETKTITPDWLVQGVLTKIGDTFDRLLGRGWKPSSSLATSELIERLKLLLDKESKQDDEGRTFVPHNISLRMQWDKFSTDAEESLKKLESEFLVAIIDHINDKHYYTYAPIEVEIRPDYFTEGVKLYVSFERFSESENEAGISVPIGASPQPAAQSDAPTARDERVFNLIARFELNGKEIERVLKTKAGQRNSVGRTKENDLAVDDISVSKYHATLLVNDAGKLLVADTGSTNGTFINDERMAYGKAVELGPQDRLKLGTVPVELKVIPSPGPLTEADGNGSADVRPTEPAPTQPAVTIDIREAGE